MSILTRDGAAPAPRHKGAQAGEFEQIARQATDIARLGEELRARSAALDEIQGKLDSATNELDASRKREEKLRSELVETRATLDALKTARTESARTEQQRAADASAIHGLTEAVAALREQVAGATSKEAIADSAQNTERMAAIESVLQGQTGAIQALGTVLQTISNRPVPPPPEYEMVVVARDANSRPQRIALKPKKE